MLVTLFDTPFLILSITVWNVMLAALNNIDLLSILVVPTWNFSKLSVEKESQSESWFVWISLNDMSRHLSYCFCTPRSLSVGVFVALNLWHLTKTLGLPNAWPATHVAQVPWPLCKWEVYKSFPGILEKRLHHDKINPFPEGIKSGSYSITLHISRWT